MSKVEEIPMINGCIRLPKEFVRRLKPGTRFTVQIEEFGLLVRPKIDPLEDLIGCVKTESAEVERWLNERVEENDSEVY
ncbi:AbrB/MazE/SpoVT family DNA-binding domain-containing protein [Dehalococcoidia bacterium]|nr:AbrB/MazE/SpoVT family DNA-binding domain-containing protein [Dehalococcoidia bacterium]MCL0097296.1 AbrB/MazE/SpoVT family DNA-binding domain-containing protein [Dehalococcoidia bacterium]